MLSNEERRRNYENGQGETEMSTSTLITDYQATMNTPLLDRNDDNNDQSSTIHPQPASSDTSSLLLSGGHCHSNPVLAAIDTYLSRLSNAFTYQFLSWLTVQHFTLNGGVMPLLWSITLPLFKGLGIDASRQQLYTTVMTSAFALKPFTGIASDLLCIRGYKKKYVALISIVIGFCGALAAVTLYKTKSVSEAILSSSQGGTTTSYYSVEDAQHLANWFTVCFFTMCVEVANLDILAEGTFSELMRHTNTGSSIISYRSGIGCIGAIITRAYVGPMSDAGNFETLLCIACVLSIASFWPTVHGGLSEKKHSSDEIGMVKLFPGLLFNRGLFEKKKMPVIAIAISGLAAPIFLVITTCTDLAIGLIFAGFILIALAVLTKVVFPAKFFRITLGLMLITLCQIKMTSAISYFYTADSECLPTGKYLFYVEFTTVSFSWPPLATLNKNPFVLSNDLISLIVAPHFSYTFYITVTGIVGSIIHLLAVILYERLMSSWRFRNSLIFLILFRSLGSVVDLIIVLRWNVAVGLPDEVLFFWGHATIENLVMILYSITLSSIYAKIAPPSLETAGYAYSAGVGSFCLIVTNVLGSGIIKWSGMTTVGENCNFDNLPRLITIYEIVFPILFGIPATLFIPNLLQTEQLIEQEWEGWFKTDDQEQPLSGE